MENTLSEHRVAQRHRMLKSAKIILDDWRMVDCTVRDMSDTGAKLRLSGMMALPHKFQLLFVTENTVRPVQIAWKLQDTIGVAFTGEATPAPQRKPSKRN